MGAMSPMSESSDVYADQSQSSEDTATSMRDQEGHSTVTATPSFTTAASFSVINYVGKVHKQSSRRSTVRSRTPYDRQTSSRTSRADSVDDITNSSSASSVDYCSASGDSAASGSEDVADMVDLDENTSAGDHHQQQMQQQHQQEHQQPHLHHGPRSRRSMSVSSSGCSSSMDDRNYDFSPQGSFTSCRCTSLSVSDFDDDGFREDVSVSSMYSVFSSSRAPYQPHHQLHHNHQNVPHHPTNTKGLFDIALKTVKLIRRNQELQMRLAQLQEETKAFVESVMANPENESLRSHFHTTGAASTPTVLVQQK